MDVCCRDPNYKVMPHINSFISFHLPSEFIFVQDSPWSENLQNKSADPQHVPVVPEEDYEEDYYDIDIRSQSKKAPKRGGKSGGYGK